jgi:hypothetical protein
MSRNSSPKLYLLHNRLEPQKDSPPVQKTLHFRHYLSTPINEHRKALTRLLLSSHPLAVERLRWSEHRRPRVTRNWRLCRFCKIAIESPEHALLECAGSNELCTLRDDFMVKVYTDIPHMPRRPMISSIDLLKRILRERSTVRLLGKFTHEVLALYEATPIYISDLAVYE